MAPRRPAASPRIAARRAQGAPPAARFAFCWPTRVGRALAAAPLWLAVMLASSACAAEPRPEADAVLRDHGAMALRCAGEDLHFRTLIDDLHETGEATNDELIVAAFLHNQANIACLRRDYPAAFEIFDAISLPNATLSLLEDLRAAEWLAADRTPRRIRH